MGLLNELKNQIAGVFFLCPYFNTLSNFNNSKLPKREILYRTEEFNSKDNEDIKEFLSMAVIATPELYERNKKDVSSGYNIHDKEFLSKHYKGEYNPEYEKELKLLSFDKPSCFVTGRQDHCVGYSIAYEIMERFPRASFAILDCAGHNLQIENEPTFAQLVNDWIYRIELEEKRNCN